MPVSLSRRCIPHLLSKTEVDITLLSGAYESPRDLCYNVTKTPPLEMIYPPPFWDKCQLMNRWLALDRT